jgi:protein-tyrosine phosphatase
MAEGAFRSLTERIGFDADCDSAGTGAWHVGNPPDKRAQHVAAVHGVDISGLRARQVSAEDFRYFTHIVALDQDNLADLRWMQPSDATADLSLLLDHVAGREGQAVADPYYGGAEGFETAWADVMAGAEALLEKIMAPE